MVPKYSAEWWSRVSASAAKETTKETTNNTKTEHDSAPILSTSFEEGLQSRSKEQRL
jgi:hypothetical protein